MFSKAVMLSDIKHIGAKLSVRDRTKAGKLLVNTW